MSTFRSLRALLASTSVVLMLAGCQTGPAAKVDVRSADADRRMTQQFTKAFFTRDEGGDFDIVLMEQALPSPPPRGSGDALASADAPPLMHVLHIKVLWRPKKAIRPDSPTATNASVQWTVLAGDGSGRLEYNGVGFARVFSGDDQIRAILRNANVKTAATTGPLEDPIGPATLEADFKARHDPAAVRAILEMLRRPATASVQSSPTDPSAAP